MNIISDNYTTAIIHSPFEKIDLTTWLFTLTDNEYQSCSTAHIAGGSSLDPKGGRISINVEYIAGNLLVQHYREEISEKEHCRVSSNSDSFSALGNTKLDITWELTIKRIDDQTCELKNHVIVRSTSEFLILLETAGIEFDNISGVMDENVNNHNKEETPLFARDIEAKANKNTWI